MWAALDLSLRFPMTTLAKTATPTEEGDRLPILTTITSLGKVIVNFLEFQQSMIKAVWICVGNFVLSSFLFVNNRKKMSKRHNIFTKQEKNCKLFF